MGIILTIIIGFFVGLVARMLRPGFDKMGMVMTTILGIAGALVGGFIGRAFGIYKIGEPAGFIASVLGAILLLVVMSAFTNWRRKT